VIPRLPGPPRDQPPPLVLVADEEPSVVQSIVEALQLHHYRVSVAEDGDEALRRAHGESPDLIIASVRLKGRGGLEICGTLRREVEWGDMPVLLLSAAGDAEARVEALAHGADDLVTKPFSSRELMARVQRLVTRARETNRYRTRSQELERDLGRLETDARRSRDDAERERSLAPWRPGPGTLPRTMDLASWMRGCCASAACRPAPAARRCCRRTRVECGR
jgi:DNA-binding response OmpR family regulator